MPSTSLSMPGLSLGERQGGAVGWAVVLTDPIAPLTTVPKAVSVSHFVWGALELSRRGQPNVAVTEGRAGHLAEDPEWFLEAT